MLDLCRIIFGIVVDLFRLRVALEAEILVLRQQIIVLRRGRPRRLSFLTVDRVVLGLHSQSDLFFIDDLDNLVLARLALKSALLRTGPIRFYSGEPHRRAALGASWMCDVLCMRNGLKLAHGVTPLPLQAGGPAVSLSRTA